MSHLHELFYRTHNADGTVTLSHFATREHSSTEPGEDWISMVDGVAKEGTQLSKETDAIVYKIDGKCEYMISREFYLWPNSTDARHARKNPSQKSSRPSRSFNRGDVR